MYCYLNLIDGQEEIFSILDLLKNVDYAPVSKDKQLQILHCAALATEFREKANMLKKASGM